MAVNLHVGEDVADLAFFVHDVRGPLGRAALALDAQLIDQAAALIGEQREAAAAGDRVLLVRAWVVHADPNNLRVEPVELAGAPTEVGGLHRSARRVRLRVEEHHQVLLAAEAAEIERAALLRGGGERGERVAYLDRHRVTSATGAGAPPRRQRGV